MNSVDVIKGKQLAAVMWGGEISQEINQVLNLRNFRSGKVLNEKFIFFAWGKTQNTFVSFKVFEKVSKGKQKGFSLN